MFGGDAAATGTIFVLLGAFLLADEDATSGADCSIVFFAWLLPMEGQGDAGGVIRCKDWAAAAPVTVPSTLLLLLITLLLPLMVCNALSLLVDFAVFESDVEALSVGTSTGVGGG